jgi:hypothetical protein
MIKTSNPINTWSVVSHPSKATSGKEVSPVELGVALGIIFIFTVLGIILIKIVSQKF